MQGELISTLQTVEIDDRASSQMRARGPLRLHRAWPRDVDHLLLEYVDRDGRLFPGQWRRDPAQVQQLYNETITVVREHDLLPRSTLARCGAHTILLQPVGEDRILEGLAAALIEEKTELVSHRPERRAVVRRHEPDGEVYLKFTRASQAQQTTIAHDWLSQQSPSEFDHARLIFSDVAEGLTVWEGIQGTSAASLSHGELTEQSRGIAQALRGLHQLPQPSFSKIHDGNAEAEVLERWFAMASSYHPPLIEMLQDLVSRCADDLRRCPLLSSPLHRDFFDKQIIITASQRIAILDFDTLSSGDPFLDVANYLAHILLRSIQRRWPSAAVSEIQKRFRLSYREEGIPADNEIIRTYLNSSLLRLACVYAFRPIWSNLPVMIARKLRTPSCFSRS